MAKRKYDDPEILLNQLLNICHLILLNIIVMKIGIKYFLNVVLSITQSV